MPSIDAQQFRDTLLHEVRSAWQLLRQTHPRDHFYCFGVYTMACAEYLTITASTEEGLSVVAEKYLARAGGDRTLWRSCLRWSPCDSPLHEEGFNLLLRSQALRDSGPDPYDDTIEGSEAIALVFDTAVEVLKQLDSENAFGTEIERARLALGILMGDQSNENMIAFARRLNPKHIVDRLAKELEEGYEACKQLP